MLVALSQEIIDTSGEEGIHKRRDWLGMVRPLFKSSCYWFRTIRDPPAKYMSSSKMGSIRPKVNILGSSSLQTSWRYLPLFQNAFDFGILCPMIKAMETIVTLGKFTSEFLTERKLFIFIQVNFTTIWVQ